jgi:hypothetical protein
MNIGWLVTLLARTTSDVSKRKKKKKKNRRKEAQKWSYPLKRKMIPAAHGTSVISPAPAPAPAPCSYLDIIHDCGIRKLSEKEKKITRKQGLNDACGRVWLYIGQTRQK